MTPGTVVHRWAVPPDHPAFEGHFPGRPILPGVVLLAEVLALAASDDMPGPWHMPRAKLTGPVLPGDMVTIALERAEGIVRFTCRVGDRPVAAGSFRRGEPAPATRP